MSISVVDRTSNSVVESQTLSGTARRRRRRRAEAKRRWLAGLGMWLLALLFLMPFGWMLSSSLKLDIDVFAVPLRWIPNPFDWANYRDVWVGVHAMGPYFANSAIVAVARVGGELLTASMAGYAFARLSFRGRDKLFLIYLTTSIVPTQLLLVPRFMFFRQLGMYDTLWALILPGVFTVFGTFLLRQAFLSAPQDYADAARLDGANEWQIYWRVYLPLVRPALAALGILAFVWSWNDYETPLIMLASNSHFTVPLGLAGFADESGGLSMGLAMAGAVSSIVPIIVIFLIFQRQFLQSLSHSGLK